MKTGEVITVYDNRKNENSIIADGKIVKIEKLRAATPRYSILLDSGYEIRIYTDKVGGEKEKD